MSLTDLFDASLLGRARAPALEHDAPGGARETLTFADLERRSNRLARVLQARGLAQGDRLAFMLANRVEIIDLWLACAKLGVVVVPVNVLYREREVAHILSDAAPAAVVVAGEQRACIAPGTTCWDPLELSATAAAADGTRAGVVRGDDVPAALVYTSGTTGTSKGAVLTHGNFAANARALCQAWQITNRDRYLAALPLFHVHGLGNGVHSWLASGCHCRLVERFDHTTAAELFESYRPTLFFGVPTMYVRLLDVPLERARKIGGCARLFVSGSAPLPAHVLDAFRERFGHVILERYGMTETLMIAGNPYDGERRAGSVGLPFPGVEVRISNAAGEDVAEGVAGELRVRGPNICAGYWRRPEATGAAWRDGWFLTGDIGSRAADGYITLHGRRSDLIISGGFNIYPREVEELLLELHGVREAVVVGVGDALRGEVPVAYVVADDAVDDTILTSHLSSQLASFKMPRAFVRVSTLPRTALGKVQKHLLPPWGPA